MAFQMLRETKEFLELFDTLQASEYFRITYATWTQLLYVLIAANRIILLDYDPTASPSTAAIKGPISHTNLTDHNHTNTHPIQNPAQTPSSTWDPALVARESSLLRLGQSLGAKLREASSAIASDADGANLMATFGLLVWSLAEGRQWADLSLAAACVGSAKPPGGVGATEAAMAGAGVEADFEATQAFPTPESSNSASMSAGGGEAVGMQDFGPGPAEEWPAGYLDAAWNSMLHDLTMIPLPVFDGGFAGSK